MPKTSRPKAAKAKPKLAESAQKSPPKAKIGRPSLYSDELADEICSRIAAGESVNKITQESDMPCRDTFFRWVFNNKQFSDKYARALEIKADIMRDEILEIADAPPEKTPFGSTDSGAVQDKRVRIDTRKWLMARQSPRKYGDKLDIDHGVQKDNPLASLIQRIAGTGLPVVKDVPDDSGD